MVLCTIAGLPSLVLMSKWQLTGIKSQMNVSVTSAEQSPAYWKQDNDSEQQLLAQLQMMQVYLLLLESRSSIRTHCQSPLLTVTQSCMIGGYLQTLVYAR